MEKDIILKQKERYKDEKVFVVLSNVMENIKDKFNKETHNTSIFSKYDNVGKYIFRYEAEKNPAFKQIIPYIILVNEHNDKVFVTDRIAGEPRLIGKCSIGVGGHINEEDGHYEPVMKCIFRELNEEVSYLAVSGLKYHGTVRDLTTELNDHVGLVFFLKVIEDSVAVAEKESLVGRWMSKEELKDNYGKFEGWAKYIIDYIYENNII